MTAAATNTAIQKRVFWSGMTTLIILSERMGDIMKIVKYLEKSGLLIKGVSKTIRIEAKYKTWISWHIAWYIRG